MSYGKYGMKDTGFANIAATDPMFARGTTGALQAVAGQGTTTSKQSGGSGLLGGVLTGLAGNSSLFCFTEDTKVKTPTGDKFIRHLNAGDEVICPHADGTETTEVITDVMAPHYSDVYSVVCDSKKFVTTTLSQPLMLANGEFKLVQNLSIGTDLKNVGKIQAVILVGERRVYDLKVTGENNYYADGFIAKGGTTEWGA